MFIPRTAPAAPLDNGVTRVRPVRLDAAGLPEAGGEIELNLFDDASFRANVGSAVRSADGATTTWAGRLRGFQRGEVTIARTGGILAANITTDAGELYQVRPDAAGGLIARQVDPASFPPEGKPIAVSTGGPPASPALLAPDDGSTIDVMVVYSSQAKQAAGGQAAIENLIELAAAETNQGYANSGVIQRIRTVHKREAAYNDQLGFETALTQLRNPSDGVLDEIHAARNTYGADMVSLWFNNRQYCGLAYVMQNPSAAFASYAFSVIHWECGAGVLAFGHELGHNQGAVHDRANSDGPGAFPYSYGYRQTTVLPRFRTIMAYDCYPDLGIACTRINQWSNPEVTYGGLPTGIAQGAPQAADNRATLNNTRIIAANWRAGVTGLPPPAATVSYPLTLVVSPATGGTLSVSPQPSGDGYAAGTKVGVTARPNFGSTFAGFSGALSGRANPQEVTMDAAKTVMAGFVGQLFTDVDPYHPYFDFINLMGYQKITTGCAASPPIFCPNGGTTRSQLAVFVVRSMMGGDGFTYSPAPYFTDVPATHPHFKWIQKARELSVAEPCAPSSFCPDTAATRGEAAVMIVRGRFGQVLSYPRAPYFEDVPASHPWFAQVQKMREAGITSGCTPTYFCVDAGVTRGQMAVFIVRAFQ